MYKLNKKYHSKIAHTSIRLPCLKCSANIYPRHMVKHLRFEHNIDTQFLCPWCLDYSWCRGDFGNNEHRLDCLMTSVETVRQSLQMSREVIMNDLYITYLAGKQSTQQPETAMEYTEYTLPKLWEDFRMHQKQHQQPPLFHKLQLSKNQ